MKAPPIQLRREFAFIGGATLLALVPLFFLWRKSAVTGVHPTTLGVSTTTLVPVVAHTTGGGRAYLSPNGRLLARMEAAAPIPGATPMRGASPRTDELVIRLASNGKEVFRALGMRHFVGWIPDSVAFVAQNVDIITVFVPSASKPGAPPPTVPWTQRVMTLPGDTDGSMGGTEDDDIDFDLQNGAIAFSPDLRYVVKGFWGKGTIVWRVGDLVTGKVSPPVSAGRWLDYDPPGGGSSSNISIAVAPANIASGPLPIVSVLQTLQLSHRSSPIPTPSPTPFITPTPTPTFSPAQIQFKAKETREEVAIQALVDSVEGVDGADPKVTDEGEIARISAEVKQRNAALDAEKQRFFPQPAQPTPTPVPKISLWDMETPFQAEALDLNTKKRLWVSPLRSNVFPPHMMFALDGSSLVVWGSSAARADYGTTTVEGVGIEFRSARTGRVTGKSLLYKGSFGTPESDDIGVYGDTSTLVNKTPRSVFVFNDSYGMMRKQAGQLQEYGEGTVLRFFTAANGHEVGYLKIDPALIPAAQNGFSNFSISQGGNFWLWGDSDVFISSRKELGQDSSGPLPTPTPYPTPMQSTHASGR